MTSVDKMTYRRKFVKDPVFYVYAYYDENGVPVYVGKGKGYRINHHACPSRRGVRLTNALLSGQTFTRVKLEEGLTEEDAFTAERRWIASFGREIDGSGSLWNLTLGGDGAAGSVMSDSTKAALRAARFGKKLTAEHKAKLSAAKIGKPRCPLAVEKGAAKIRGRPRTPEAIASTAAGNRGKKRGPQSPEHIEKAAATRRGRKFSESAKANMVAAACRRTPEFYEKAIAPQRVSSVCVETGAAFKGINFAARELGLHVNAIWLVLKGRRKTTGGLSFRYAEVL